MGDMSKKPDWLFTQAAALPFFCMDDSMHVVLVTSLSAKKWILPKGVIDPGETPESTALKEAREEAGVLGQIAGESLGSFRHEKWGGVANVEVFPLRVQQLLDEWDERKDRQRLVIPVDEAKQKVARKMAPFLEAIKQRGFDAEDLTDAQ